MGQQEPEPLQQKLHRFPCKQVGIIFDLKLESVADLAAIEPQACLGRFNPHRQPFEVDLADLSGIAFITVPSGPDLVERAKAALGIDDGEWAKLGGQAAALRYTPVNLPSRTAARTTATRCAPLGNHLIHQSFPIRELPMSSAQSSARDEEIGRPLRYRQP